MHTEEGFVQNLQILVNVYQIPMKELAEKKKVITVEQVKTIFSDIDIILKINQGLGSAYYVDVVRTLGTNSSSS